MNRTHSIAAITVTCLSASLAAAGRGQAVRDSAGIHIIENGAPAWTARTARHLEAKPALTLGAGGGAPEEEFGHVQGAIRLKDGSIVVADQKNRELRVFGPTGKFIRTIGQKGEGPGDFQYLSALFRLQGDTILAWDSRPHRLTWFTVDGKVQRTSAVDHPPSIPGPRGSTTLNLSMLGPLHDGTLLAEHGPFRFNPPTGVNSDSFFVSRVSPGGAVKPILALLKGESYVFRGSDGKMTTFGDRPFTTKGTVATTTASLWHTDGVRFELREFDSSGKLRRIVSLRRQLTPVTQPDIVAYEAAGLDELAHEKFRDESSRPRAIDLQHQLYKWMSYPKSMPAFSALFVDPAGGLWAREYGDSTKVQHWDAFDRSGKLLGVVEFPAGLNVFEIGADYVLGSVLDQDDVESVRLYRFAH